MGLSATLSFPYNTGAWSAPSDEVGSGAISLLGTDWMLDLSKDEFRERTVQMTRDQLNVGAGSGEEALSSGMLWKRSVTSWHKGAGQREYDDNDTRDPYRFYQSRRIDVWTEGQLSLLPATSLVKASSQTFQRVMIVADKLWHVAGAAVKVIADTATWADFASLTLSAAPVSVSPAGDRMYACLPAKLVEVTLSGSTLTETIVLSQSFDGVAYRAGRLFAWKGPSLWEVRFSPAATLQLIEQRPSGFQWLGVRQASGVLTAGGNDGSRGTIWLLTIDADVASGWAPARQVLELPDGERIHNADTYLGFIVLATDAGVRLIQAGSDGSLVSGAPLEVPVSQGVVGFEGQDRFVWVGTVQTDGQAGLARLDLSAFTSPLAPAWASDIEAWETPSAGPLSGAVESATTFNGKLVFTVAGKGLVAQSTSVEKSGWLNQGWVSFGTADPKTPTEFTVLTQPLPVGGSVLGSTMDDLGREAGVIRHDEVGTTRETQASNRVQSVGQQLTMSLGATTATPGVLRWDMRAAPTTSRATLWTLPIVIASRLDFAGNTQDRDPFADYSRLRRSVMVGALTTLTVDHATHVVQPVEFDWRPTHPSYDGTCYQGTMVLTCLTVEGDAT